uniref:Putative chitinase 1 n=1 Tax=Margaritifera margaritifera TaxID=102329 RepID=CHI1_PINMG|nr:RecName: Full=Putative chitinase 1; AltName: Full=Chitinase-like protein 1; Short=Clp1; Flags: Precursor [Pinctada margaritifera]CCE46155.1 clp1 protein [Pinctada margaritifera]
MDFYSSLLPFLILIYLEFCSGFNRVCYYNGWALYRDSEHALKPENIDAFLCTHLVFAFGAIDETGTRIYVPEVFEDMHLFERMNELRHRNEDLNLVLSVGGWDMGSEAWSEVLASKDNMQTFVKEAIVYLRLHDFDGIDLDWEYPTFRGSKPIDREKFTQLIEIFRHEMDIEETPDDKWDLCLSVAVDPSEYMSSSSYEIDKITKNIDFYNLKMYDFHGHWNDPVLVKHHSALTSSSSLPSVNELAKMWVQRGVPKRKINIGIPFFGRSYRTAQPNATIGDPALGPGSDGGIGIPVSNICHLIRGGTKEHYLKEENVPFIVNGDEWVGFDNPRSVREKAALVRNNRLGGIMVWAIDMDDHSGWCGEKFPLMMSIIHGLGEYVDYMSDTLEAEREMINKKIRKAAREISYYSDKGNSTMAKKMEDKLNQLKDHLSAVQAHQSVQWANVQYSAGLGGKPLPSKDTPSWSW